MLSYKHILLCTDLSSQAKHIAERAKEIADKSHAKLSVIHVIEHSPVAYGGEFSIPIDVNLEQMIESHVRENLADMSKEFGIAPQHQHIENGTVKAAVIQKVKALNVDLIVVGTHGHHGLDILLGSRANAILHLAPCDVLVVKIKRNVD